MSAKHLLISIVAIGAIVGSIAVVRATLAKHHAAARHKAQQQWILTTSNALRQLGPPSATNVAAAASGAWIAGQHYLLFSNGWASFAWNDFHAGGTVGDIALLLSSDGGLYVSRYHFCVGLSEFYDHAVGQPLQPRPRDLNDFFQRYGTNHNWRGYPES